MAQACTRMAPADSLWASTAAPLRTFPSLSGEIHADVVIIGAGYTGLSAAHHIARSGLAPVVVEANHPGWGASGRNGGVITAKFRQSFSDIDVAHGRGMAKRMYEIAHESVEIVEELVSEFGITAARLRRNAADQGCAQCADVRSGGRRGGMDEARNGRFGCPHSRYLSGVRRDRLQGVCRRRSQSGFRRHPSLELPARASPKAWRNAVSRSSRKALRCGMCGTTALSSSRRRKARFGRSR